MRVLEFSNPEPYVLHIIFLLSELYLQEDCYIFDNLVLCFILTINWFMLTLFRGVLIMTFGGYTLS
jgi:hypothetical protein